MMQKCRLIGKSHKLSNFSCVEDAGETRTVLREIGLISSNACTQNNCIVYVQCSMSNARFEKMRKVIRIP